MALVQLKHKFPNFYAGQLHTPCSEIEGLGPVTLLNYVK